MYALSELAKLANSLWHSQFISVFMCECLFIYFAPNRPICRHHLPIQIAAPAMPPCLPPYVPDYSHSVALPARIRTDMFSSHKSFTSFENRSSGYWKQRRLPWIKNVHVFWACLWEDISTLNLDWVISPKRLSFMFLPYLNNSHSPPWEMMMFCLRVCWPCLWHLRALTLTPIPYGMPGWSPTDIHQLNVQCRTYVMSFALYIVYIPYSHVLHWL